MRRTLRSKIAIATAVALACTSCQSTQASESETTQTAETTTTSESTPASDPVDESSATAQEGSDAPPAAETTETRDGVLLDYYGGDSRDTIQKMEGQLKPLEVVKPGGSDDTSNE